MLSDKFFPVTYASSYLWEKLQQAIKDVNNLPKSALASDPASITTGIISRYSYQLLSLDKKYEQEQKRKYKARVIDQSPREVNINWPITGSTDLLGKLDGSNDFVTSKLKDGAICETWACAHTLGSNKEALERIRRNIEKKTAFFEQHFDRLNRSVTAYNQELERTIPGLVEKRLELLTQLREAEKFLN